MAKIKKILDAAKKVVKGRKKGKPQPGEKRKGGK